ncbi:MAG: dihydrofolate reductase family protein [Candidatus Thorarchaeota archaeon]
MGKLIYSAITSLDGYIEDEKGNFDWAVPDEMVHIFINNLERPVGTYLYGRRMYEIMAVWEAMHTRPGQTYYTLDFASIWQAAEKIVYSKTLEDVTTAKTRIEREFDIKKIKQMKTELGYDILIGGPNLAGQAIKAGVVDEFHFFITPIIVGGGKHFLPLNVKLKLELLEEHRFTNGMVYIRYHKV